MPPRDPLDDLMDRWAPPPSVPDVRAEIRREISRLSANDLGSWLGRVEAAFSRPSFAITFVTACVLLGLFLAEARVSRLHAANGAQIARSYVQLIDPLIGSAADAALPTRRP